MRRSGSTPEAARCWNAPFYEALVRILRPMVDTQFDRIRVDPDRLGGKPSIRGLRVSVGMVVQMVAAGKTTAEILAEYPYLEAEDVRQSLAYSAALAEATITEAQATTTSPMTSR